MVADRTYFTEAGLVELIVYLEPTLIRVKNYNGVIVNPIHWICLTGAKAGLHSFIVLSSASGIAVYYNILLSDYMQMQLQMIGSGCK